MMKFVVLIFLVSVAVAASAPSYSNRMELDRILHNEWESFVSKNKKNYHEDEEEVRKEEFNKNMKDIIDHNDKGESSYTRCCNGFTDMSDEEKNAFNGGKPDEKTLRAQGNWTARGVQTRSVPSSLDLSQDNCMQEPKNQASCGSCWAFTAIAPLEYVKCKASGHRFKLSEQQLVDCDLNNGGCNGGWYTSAWQHLMNGSNKHSKYGAYTARRGRCVEKAKFNGAIVKDYRSISPNQDAMKEALQDGPLAVALRVVKDFYSYKSGVYSSTNCGGAVNHAVVIVGYGRMSGTDYWIVRNSWGSRWGMEGHILIERGVNMCNIEQYAAAVYV